MSGERIEQRFAYSLLAFAVRLYTRVHEQPSVKWNPYNLRWIPVSREFTIDNGKRPIKVRLEYGPEFFGEYQTEGP